MNEIRIIYFGSVSDISATLLHLLNIVEVRPTSNAQSGFYVFETRFGQESVRPLSLDATDPAAKDILIYRYLSDREREALHDPTQSRRVFVLLHNFLNLDYIASELKAQEHNQFNFLVDMSSHDYFKPFAYASKLLPSKNFYRVVKAKSADKPESRQKAGWHLPMFLLIVLKFLINPINEVKRLAVIAKHSNLRVLSRVLELVIFIDFVLRAVIFHSLRLLGLQLFYRSNFVAGIIKVVSVKSAYFFRHVLLMSAYKIFGFAVDGFNLMVRLKDVFITTVYYRFLHKLYFRTLHILFHDYIKKFVSYVFYRTVHILFHEYVKRFVSFVFYEIVLRIYYEIVLRFYFKIVLKIYYKGLLGSFYWALPKINSARLFLRYNVPHAITMGYYKAYGWAFDFSTFCYRFTKLVLFYPVRKVYWFSRFQYEKRLKKFLV